MSALTIAEVPGPIPSAPIRKLLAAIFRRPLVVLVDFDDEANVRVGWRDAAGRWSASRHGWGIRNVLLLAGGRLGHGSYVERWVPLNAKAAALAGGAK